MKLVTNSKVLKFGVIFTIIFAIFGIIVLFGLITDIIFPPQWHEQWECEEWNGTIFEKNYENNTLIYEYNHTYLLNKDDFYLMLIRAQADAVIFFNETFSVYINWTTGKMYADIGDLDFSRTIRFEPDNCTKQRKVRGRTE